MLYAATVASAGLHQRTFICNKMDKKGLHLHYGRRIKCFLFMLREHWLLIVDYCYYYNYVVGQDLKVIQIYVNDGLSASKNF